MSDLRREKGAAPRKDKSKPQRVRPDTVSWGRELARRAKVGFDEGEFDDMLAGEADARQELEEERRAVDGALQDFHDASDECDDLGRQVNALLGGNALPATFIGREVALVAGLRDAIGKDLENTDPGAARAKLAQLQQTLADAADAAGVRARMTALVDEQTERFRAAQGLTGEEIDALEAQRTQALATIAADGGWEWEAWEAPLGLRTLVEQSLAAAEQRAETARKAEEARRAEQERLAKEAERIEAERIEAERIEAERIAEEKRRAEAAPGVVVGGPGLSAMMLAARHFDPAYNEALAVLQSLETSKKKFPDREAIVAEVAKNQVVAAKMAEATAARERREREQQEQARRERQQREERAASPVAYQFRTRRGGTVTITEYDIAHGRWERVQFRSDGSLRPQSDYGLFVTIDGAEVSFHLHPPSYDGRPPLPGGFKFSGGDPGLNQTPTELMPIIIRLKGWPPEWGKNPYGT